MIKKVIFVIILIGFLVIVYSNGNAKDVSMDQIEETMTKNTEIEKMEKASNRDLMQFINLDYEQVNSYIYYRNTAALSVEEILIVKVNDDSQLDSIKDIVEERIDNEIKTFEGYGAAQVSMLKNAIITTKGNYLFYCASKSPEKYEEVFLNVI